MARPRAAAHGADGAHGGDPAAEAGGGDAGGRQAVVDEVGAHRLRDMGKCMGALKQRYPGRMDFGKAGRVVKEMLK